jgi:hypothetical protein
LRARLALAAAALALAPAHAAEVPAELRGRISAEVTSCEPFRGSRETRVVLVRVRAGASGVRNPEIRCAAAAGAGEHVLGWARVRGIEEVAAGEVREAMVLVPADAAHDACRCVVAESRQGALCAPWQALEDGRCVEPADVAAAPPAPADELTGALQVSRALGPLREPNGAAGADAVCARVQPAQLRELVFALVPEDETVYVRSLWHRLDALDQRAFARWARECFGVARLVDAERGVELAVPSEAPSAR